MAPGCVLIGGAGARLKVFVGSFTNVCLEKPNSDSVVTKLCSVHGIEPNINRVIRAQPNECRNRLRQRHQLSSYTGA